MSTRDQKTCTDYVFSRLTLLPPPEPKHIIIDEEVLLQQRLRINLEYLMTGGKGTSRATEEQSADIEQVLEQSNYHLSRNHEVQRKFRRPP